MANWITQGITNYIGGYVDSMVASVVQTGGGFAGDAVGAVGNGINGVGGGIEKSIRRYGDGAKDYGNSIKDWTSASGVRQPTAFNPLGLPDTMTGGKRGVSSMPGSMSTYQSKNTSSPAYKAPSSVGTKSAVKPRNTSSAPKGLPAPAKASAKGSSKTPAKKPTPSPAAAKKAPPPSSKYSPPAKSSPAAGAQKKPPPGAAKKPVPATKKPPPK